MKIDLANFLGLNEWKLNFSHIRKKHPKSLKSLEDSAMLISDLILTEIKMQTLQFCQSFEN